MLPSKCDGGGSSRKTLFCVEGCGDAEWRLRLPVVVALLGFHFEVKNRPRRRKVHKSLSLSQTRMTKFGSSGSYFGELRIVLPPLKQSLIECVEDFFS